MGKRRSRSNARKAKAKKKEPVAPTPAPLPSFADGLPASNEESFNSTEVFPVSQSAPNDQDDISKHPPPVPHLNDDDATKPTPEQPSPKTQDPSQPKSPSSLQKHSPKIASSIPSPSFFDTSSESDVEKNTSQVAQNTIASEPSPPSVPLPLSPHKSPKIAAMQPSDLFATSSESDEDLKRFTISTRKKTPVVLPSDDSSDDDRKPPAITTGTPTLKAPPSLAGNSSTFDPLDATDNDSSALSPDAIDGVLTAFANDPVRSRPLKIPRDHIEDLKGPSFLKTTLLDFILQQAIPKTIPENVIIGTSNSLSFLELMNKKDINSTNSGDAKTARALRRKYQFFSRKRYRFLAVNCATNHFFVISLEFDGTLPNIFESVCVYDSLRRSTRKKDPVLTIGAPAQFLRQFQLFLANFCFFNTKRFKELMDHPDMILQHANYIPCPAQENSFDCGLFGLATALHLVHGLQPDKKLFTQRDITSLRQGLYRELAKGSAPSLQPSFVSSFLPLLNAKELSADDEDSEDGPSSEDSDDSSYDLGSDHESSVASVTSVASATVGLVDDVTASDAAIPTPTAVSDVEDAVFKRVFLDNDQEFECILDVIPLIDDYEEQSGNRLVITKSNQYARTYVCRSHVGCSFRIRFGRKRGTISTIVLKKNLTVVKHNGEKAPPMANGRAYKKRLKGRFDDVVAHVTKVKAGKPVAKDIMKAVATLKHTPMTYKQSFRVLQTVVSRKWENDAVSFQMVIPYLRKFKQLNPESTTEYEVQGQNLERIFVCPGIMKRTLAHVRPVLSLDAAHLKSKWKGTLYCASVMTGADEIYPVAVAIMNGNENEAGWSWFLELLHGAIEILVMDHPNPLVRYKYFTFMSDRQKGLIQALRKHFPNNHSCYCAIHIARNAENNCSRRLAGMVQGLAKTFSHLTATRILEAIGNTSRKGKQYLEEIPSHHWRSTSWMDDPGLPARYGIVSSNMSEATNNMFQDAREGSWLYSLDFMLGKMMERISDMRKKVRGKEGVLENIVWELKKKWDACAGFKVVEVSNCEYGFSVGRLDEAEGTKRYNLDVVNQKCTCGEWQEHSLPCEDAMAFFRHEKGITFNEVLERYVPKDYTYQNAQELLSLNISPVCMDNIAPDGTTLPPTATSKRASGRPKKLRMRKRSRFADNPEESNVVCSKCKKRGHNVRTCDLRAWLDKEAEKRSKKEKNNTRTSIELDLS